MIYIGFAIRNPFKQRHEIVWCKDFKVSENKSIEIGIYRNTNIIEGSFDITSLKQDHAGFSFDFGMFSWNFDFHFYDKRHYDDR